MADEEDDDEIDEEFEEEEEEVIEEEKNSVCKLHNKLRFNLYLKYLSLQVDEKKRKIAANSNSKGGKAAKRPKIENEVSNCILYYKLL